MSAHWEHFEHEADMGVRGSGDSAAMAFEQAAVAMMAVIADLDAIEAKHRVVVECEAPDLELLLVDWLNALVFEMATRHMLFRRFAVQIEGSHLRGEAWGEAVNVEKHHPAVEVKGATYTGLKVTRNDAGRWIAQCVVDV